MLARQAAHYKRISWLAVWSLVAGLFTGISGGFQGAVANGSPVPTVSAVDPAAGPVEGGTVITLTGTGFASGATVTVGGVAAEDVNVDELSQEITAKTPVRAGSARTAGLFDVVVTVAGEASIPDAYSRFSYIPALNSVSPSSGAAAGGTAITVQGLGFVAGLTTLTIGGVSATDVVVVNETTLTAKTPVRAVADRSVGVQAIVVTVGGVSSDSELGYTYRPVIDESVIPGTIGNTATHATYKVNLGEALADRTQRKLLEITPVGSQFEVTGWLGPFVDPKPLEGITEYSFLTDVNYADTSRRGKFREGDPDRAIDTNNTNNWYVKNPSQSAEPVSYELFFEAWCNTTNTIAGVSGPNNLAYCSFFGPELYTEPFRAEAGQAISFRWKAQGGGDDYEVYAFLVKVDAAGAAAGAIPAGNLRADHTTLLYSRGKTVANYVQTSAEIPSTGTYRFRFVNGSFDQTGGGLLGAKMFIDQTIIVGLSNVISAPVLSDRSSGNSPFTFEASATSGARVIATVAPGSRCTASSADEVVDGKSVVTVTYTSGAGSCTVRLNQGETGQFAPAQEVVRPFNWIVPTVPQAPSISSISAGNASVTIVVAPPPSDGGAPVLEYQYSVDGGTSWLSLDPSGIVSGLVNGQLYEFRVRARNSVGLSLASASETATPVAPPPAPAPAPPPPVVQQTMAPLGPQPPRQLTLPPQPPVLAPVLQNNQAPLPPVTPQALVNGVPTQVSTLVTDPNNLNIRTGVLNIGINVQTDQGLVRQATNGQTEVQVRSGGVTGFQGTGLAPRSTVQVFMPLQGNNAKELARIPVDETGTFNGEAVFATSLQEAPLPIGRQVLQMVSVDERGRQNVVEFTVNIVQPPPSPEVNRQAGVTPQLQPGQSLATNAGIPEVVQVIALQDEKQTIIEGDGWVMAVDVNNPNASVQETADGGVLLELVRDEEATVSGSGFMPGTRADVWLFSEPTLLGTVDIDENGQFNGTVRIDGQVVAVGEHTLQLQGVGMDGYVRAANLGVIVNDEEVLAEATAEAAGEFLWWLLILVLVAVLAAAGYLWWRRQQGQNA